MKYTTYVENHWQTIRCLEKKAEFNATKGAVGTILFNESYG